jgi:FkbM family methyltransferase
MIIEIGTSDFDTLAGIVPGIFIEPIKYYYDKLPAYCTKENIAISNYNGSATAYYVEYSDIVQYGLPDWIRGCNSINSQHPTVVKTLNEYGLSLSLIKEQSIEVRRLIEIISKYQISTLDLLKIDTEGHDATIILDYFSDPSVLPTKIIFENNILSDNEEISKAILLLEKHNYKITHEEYNSIGTLS